jgi:membrane-associated phospholipid phosphatase
MTDAPRTSQAPSGYASQLGALLWNAVAQLIRAPSHPRRAAAARYWARRSLMLGAITAVIITTLMFVIDETEIGLMPARGTKGLWPLRIITDFGKDEYVLLALLLLMIALALLAPFKRGLSRAALAGFGTRVQYIFLSVVLSVSVGEIIKGIVGRGRPFVGGPANPFNYSHFAWSEAYASFPSGHATTSFALAFAVAAVWPRLRTVMIVYAVVICSSRLVLLAHHASDVVAGGLVGWVGAMTVRYWFAARHLAFTIHSDGTIDPLPGPSAGHLKRVAREALAP